MRYALIVVGCLLGAGCASSPEEREARKAWFKTMNPELDRQAIQNSRPIDPTSQTRF